jgi:hypothetical protein
MVYAILTEAGLYRIIPKPLHGREDGMENMIGETLILKKDLTLVAIPDRAALLDVENRRYFDPNDTASFLLKLMENGCLYEEIKVALVSEFDVAEHTALVDLDNFVGELLRLSLVEVGAEATAHEIVREPSKERKPYQAPQLENEADIAVACAPNGVSPGTA